MSGYMGPKELAGLSDDQLFEQLKGNPNLPQHLAIIMDGNGRWAEARGMPRMAGHEAGVESVRAITRHAAAIGLEQLTLYAFSTENWKRPKEEVDFLMGLLARYVESERDELMANGVRLGTIGRLEGLPADTQAALARTREATSSNTQMRLCLALNYGGQTELADAALGLARAALAGRVDVEALQREGAEEALGAHLYQSDMPPLDLLVRTAGEQRLSNFLLWQMAYAEILVTDVAWPDFRAQNLDAALAAFATRSRRFGGLAERIQP